MGAVPIHLFARLRLKAALLAILSISLGSAGLWLSSQHPVNPGIVTAAFCVAVSTTLMRPGSWLLTLPAGLPFLNFSPWTGWLIFDEFDLLVMAVFAAGYARLAHAEATATGPHGAAPLDAWQRVGSGSMLLLAAIGLGALPAGLGEIARGQTGLFGGYGDPANSVRAFKPMCFAVLTLPLLGRELRDAASCARATRRLAWGMCAGLTIMTLAVCWERAGNPGFFNFSSSYRTVALFWEMHVGGATIDAYLALAVPFVAWALWSAKSWRSWGAAAALALLTEYACLTTYSRGVYLAAVAPLALLAFLLVRSRPERRCGGARATAIRRRTVVLVMVMIVEAVSVLGSGRFMLGRIAASERDIHSRLLHWQHGLSLLHDPADWAFGLGLGRFPTRYAGAVPGGEFPGEVRLSAGPGETFVSVAGPRSMRSLGGLYGLTQRLPAGLPDSPRLEFDVRSDRATHVRVSVCKMHLLYEQRCQVANVDVEPSETQWRPMAVELVGPRWVADPWYMPRMLVLAITVVDEGRSVDLDNLSLRNWQGVEWVRNGGFSESLAHWFPAATNQFLPWHVDSLGLELLIGQGGVGLVLFFAVMVSAMGRHYPRRTVAAGMAPFLVASLAGAMIVGLVSSVLDTPRVAFLLFLVALVSLRVKPSRSGP